MRTTFTTCISHPLSHPPTSTVRIQYETLRWRCIYITLLADGRYSSIYYGMCMYMHLYEHVYVFCGLSRQWKFMRVSFSACFRRSELLGCMTLPLPLSQDKVNITKLRVYIRDVRSTDIRSWFVSRVYAVYHGVSRSLLKFADILILSVLEKFLTIN